MKQLDLSNRLALKSFTDNDIFEIQDNFLNPGFHSIKFETIESGRLLFKLLLNSLQFYTRKAYLSNMPFDIPISISNLYQELSKAGAMSLADGILEDYLLNSFYYDFLLIEATDNIKKQNWFTKFKSLLIDYNIIQSLPIVIFSYQI